MMSTGLWKMSNEYEGETDKVQLHIRIDRYLKDFLQEWADQEAGGSMSAILLRYIHAEWTKQKIRENNGDVDSI